MWQRSCGRWRLKIANEPLASSRRQLLSARERQCLVWIALGKSSWDIGQILSISENTVNFHIRNVMRKLETSTRTAAAVKAIQLALIEVPGEVDMPHDMTESFKRTAAWRGSKPQK